MRLNVETWHAASKKQNIMTIYQINILNPKAEKLLKDLADLELISISEVNSKELKLYPEQKEMLLMSEADIAYGRVVSEAELDKLDEEWLS